MNKDELAKKKDDLKDIEESRRINAAMKRAVRNIKDVDITGIKLFNGPPRKMKDTDLS